MVEGVSCWWRLDVVYVGRSVELSWEWLGFWVSEASPTGEAGHVKKWGEPLRRERQNPHETINKQAVSSYRSARHMLMQEQIMQTLGLEQIAS